MTTRLEQLVALRARLDLEIRAEKVRAWGDGGRIDSPVRPKVAKHRADTAQERLRDLGVTAREVKEWALRTGLIAEIKRGRISGELVEAYAADLVQGCVQSGSKQGIIVGEAGSAPTESRPLDRINLVYEGSGRDGDYA